MNRKGIQEIREIQREHLRRVLAKKTPLGIPETVIRLMLDLLLVHGLMTGENEPCKHMTDVREQHRRSAQFAGVSEQKAAWLYDKYLEAVDVSGRLAGLFKVRGSDGDALEPGIADERFFERCA